MAIDPASVRLAHGLHRSIDVASDEIGRIACLLSVCPDDAVVSGLTAARLHGLWLPPMQSGRLEVIVHVSKGAPTLRSYNKRPELRARRQWLHPTEVTELHGLPVTTEARTWLDLADRFSGGHLLALGDSALRGGTTSEEIAQVLLRARHRPGVRRARQIHPLLDARARSRPESHLRWILLDGGLPAPDVNVAVYSDAGEWLFEPDLGYDDVRVGVEYNGEVHGTPERMQKDITRATDVEGRGGWRVVTFGKVQVFQRPDVVVRRVRALRAERAHLSPLSSPKRA